MFNSYDSDNVTKKVVKKSQDKRFILAVVNRTTVYNKRVLLENEVEGLVGYINKIDFNLLKDNNPNAIVDAIARNFVIQLNKNKNKTPNIHETLKGEIGSIPYSEEDYEFETNNHRYNIAYLNNGNDEEKEPVLIEKFDNGMGSKVSKEKYINKKALKMKPQSIASENGSDIHEVMKSIIKPSSNLAEETFQLENSTKAFNSKMYKYPRISKLKLQNIYLFLDSKYRDLSTDVNTFRWTVLNTNGATQGTVNTLSDQIHNIITMQFDKFNIPYVASADNVYRRISLTVKEFSSMAIIQNNGRRHHALFSSEISGPTINLTPLVNDKGRFRFYTPLNILDTLTINFQSPFVPVRFLKDRYLVTLTVTSPNTVLLTFDEDHFVADGELILLEEFNTLDPSGDSSEILFMNREEGHIVTFISDTELQIEAELTGATLDPNNLIKCFIASRRIIIPLRMEYIVE